MVPRELVTIVVPVYNEQEVIEFFHERLIAVINQVKSHIFEVIYVNDGSTDKSQNIIEEIVRCNTNSAQIRLINFTRNFGHQAALIAGLRASKGLYTVTIDADLQDPPEIIPDMLEQFKNGNDIIVAKRISRAGESIFKKLSALVFYRALNSVSEIRLIPNSGDFRMMNRKSLESLLNSIHGDVYIRGLVSWIGYKVAILEYHRDPRFAGKSNYSLSKMINLATTAILTFSYKPLRFSSVIGFIGSFLTALVSIFLVFQKIMYPNNSQPGYTSIVIILLWGFSIVFLCIGILGEYLARLMKSQNKRPMYIENS